MALNKITLFGLVIFCCVCPYMQAEQESSSDGLISPLNAQTFRKIAYELYSPANATISDAKLAMVLLNSAMDMDPRGNYVYEDMLRIMSRDDFPYDGDRLLAVLRKYVSEKSDMELIRAAVKKLLAGLDTREQREEFLARLLRLLGKESEILTSELTTQIAFLKAETTDNTAASNYFFSAYSNNPYNALAFERLEELLAEDGQGLNEAVYARYYRYMMGVDLLDIDTAIIFARFAEQIEMYDVAAGTYQYCVDLFGYLFPGEKLPASIYLPWAICNYNTERRKGDCLKIASVVRQSGRFDLVLEAIAGRAAIDTGNVEQIKKMEQVAIKAEKMLESETVSTEVTAEQMAWFYSFAFVDKAKALAWANRAYSAESALPAVKAVFAYALMNDEDTELQERIILAKGLVMDIYKKDQISAVTMGLVQLAEKDVEGAIETFRSAVAMDPASLVAARARELLLENESEYVSEVAVDDILTMLKSEFGSRIVPEFKPIEQMLSVKLALSDYEFTYGRQFTANLVITNNSDSPLLFGEYGLLDGHIRVDASLSGDINIKLPMLISKKIGVMSPIKTGQYVSVPLELNTGLLRRILLTYPQASIEMKFVACIDPIIDNNGQMNGCAYGLAPATAFVKRQGMQLSKEMLKQRFELLKMGQVKQKVRSVQAFAGLLAEQNAVKRSKPLYRMAKLERSIMLNAVKQGLSDDNWSVKSQTMLAILPLSSSDDEASLTKLISSNMTALEWPVRMAAIYLLNESQRGKFSKVLDWAAESDENENVRDLAIALGGVVRTGTVDSSKTLIGKSLGESVKDDDVVGVEN